MGLCKSCLKGSSSDYTTPDMETRRRQQVEAVEKRLKEQENRGIKDPEKVRRMQERSNELERLEREAARSNQESGLKWQMN
ncbi:small VCP/p97-interacting protein [Macrosteles quadrilineatus]|uniref:small VCP/p97-interacting protein n=1 Tax=Macrosteles quadrilineatus TaxID=74068 RepID=UPI0023E0DD41|nr:small VCP/p97-interacting protein [Macrosteles quadrilineatus]